MLGAEVASVSNEFDIIVHMPIQTAVLGTVETENKILGQSNKTIWCFVYLAIHIPTLIKLKNLRSV